MTVQTFARVTGCLLGLALLAACAGGPTVSSQSESSRYRARASRSYAAPGPASDPWGPYITEASRKYDVPERWIREVMRQESGGQQFLGNGDLMTSGAGAMGLMQVMPATYDELRGRYSELGDDPYDPHNNIRAGAAYIREMYDIFGSPAFLAAYNAGPGRLDDYLTRNRTLPEETRRYVAAIGPRIAGVMPGTPSPGALYASNAGPSGSPAASHLASRYDPPPAGGPVIVPNPPAQLAQAEPPRGPFITLHAPAPDASAPDTPPPVRLAQAEEPPPAPFITLHPPSPPPPSPVRQPSSVRSEPLPEPRPIPAPVQVAQVPEPPRPAPFPPSSPQQFAAAALVPVMPRQSRFALVSPARAEPVEPRQNGFSSGDWAVQVGAFANRGVAVAAAGSARSNARDVLGRTHTSVTSVRQPSGLLYRARLTGLSRGSAAQACERLEKTRIRCMVVSPDAQS